MISVLHGSAWYPPAHIGGTEVYVAGLVRELRAHGINSRVVTPLGLEQSDSYEFEGAAVRTYPVSATTSRAELRGDVRPQSLSRFSEILADEGPDIYHQHSWTRGLGAAHLRAARGLGLRTVLTVHVPNNICLRGTMMRFGQSACDGHINEVKCGECWCHGRGAPKLLARVLARVPSAFGSAVRQVGLDGRFATALSAKLLVSERRSEFASMVDNADRVVAVCKWLYDALSRNGVPTKKLVLSRHGVEPSLLAAAQVANCVGTAPDGVFRLLYLGRWHPVKGVDVLVRAVRAIPKSVRLALVIHGVGDGADERAYEAMVRRLAEGDKRIQIAPPVPRERLVETLSQASALAVPSCSLETGPLVVLEAKAVGLPIIGSRLGGIAELTREPEDGVLVAPGDVDAWTNAIISMANGFQTTKLVQCPLKVRTMGDVATDMAKLYQDLHAC